MAIWNDIFRKILKPIVDESVNQKKGAAIEKAIFAQQMPLGAGPIDSSNTIGKKLEYNERVSLPVMDVNNKLLLIRNDIFKKIVFLSITFQTLEFLVKYLESYSVKAPKSIHYYEA